MSNPIIEYRYFVSQQVAYGSLVGRDVDTVKFREEESNTLYYSAMRLAASGRVFKSCLINAIKKESPN